MNQQTTKKRRPSATGVKALIASAAVAATLAGWALLPANDPGAAAAGTDTAGPAPALGLPQTTDPGSANGSAQAPAFQAPLPSTSDPGLPQVQPSQGFFGGQQPFARTRSSR